MDFHAEHVMAKKKPIFPGCLIYPAPLRGAGECRALRGLHFLPVLLVAETAPNAPDYRGGRAMVYFGILEILCAPLAAWRWTAPSPDRRPKGISRTHASHGSAGNPLALRSRDRPERRTICVATCALELRDRGRG